MGRRGPKPKPTIVQIAEGNPGKRKINKDVSYEKGARPPAVLDARAREVWARLAPELEQKGLLLGPDADLFGAYCQAVSNYEAALRKVQDGELINEHDQVSPYYTAMKNERREMARLGALFGFSPADRARLAAPGEKPEDEYDKFMKARRA